MRRFIKSLSLFLASVIVSLAIAEGFLHAFPSLLPIEVRQVFDNKGVAHPVIGNLPEPGATGVIVTRDFESPFQLDDHGFRNVAPWPDVPDIVAIGDSLVFGYGVDESEAWPQRVSSLLRRSVVNMGLIGASPQQYRKIYEVFAQPVQPGIVVVGFFARNDFWDAERYAAWEQSGVGGNYLIWRGFGSPTAKQYSNPAYRVVFEMRQRSYLLALLKLAKDALVVTNAVGPTGIELQSGSRMLLHTEDFREKTILASPDNETFETVVQELLAIRDANLREGSRLIVLLQPGKEEIYAGPDGAPAADASEALRDRLDENGIEYIDATPVFRELAASGAELFFPTDGHPNSAGYAVLAEIVADYIRNEAADNLPADPAN